MQAVQPDASSRDQLFQKHPVKVLIVIALAFAGVILMRGQGGPWSARAIAVTDTLFNAAWAPLTYQLASAGYGRLVRPWIPAAHGRWCIELGFGLTLMLSITHLIGMLGMLSPLTVWLITGIGLILLIPRLKEQDISSTDPGLSLFHIVIVCGMMLALLMACNPPGVQWGSEYGGFDALSYHLQLPREWIEQGRIWPSEHNVYSFLPSYIESAYAHIALMMGGGMHNNGARAAMSAQLLSALMLIVSAGAIGQLGRVACARVLPDADDVLAGRIGIALTLGTPWLLVVGTLAYNEIAVVLLGACALLAAMQTEIPAWKRAVLCGVIVGGTCSCKPTALFLLAPSVGIVLLACTARKYWFITTLACCAAGALTIAPWLIRNELATGNPVFPQMVGVFGLGHWSEAQHAVYAAAHSFDGSVLDRFAMLVVPDADGTDHVSRFRGLTNAQWGVVPLLGLLGLVALLAKRSTRWVGLVCLAAVCVPLVCWAMLTHIQSRFLIPLAPVLIVLACLGVAQIKRPVVRESLGAVLCVGSMVWCVAIALAQGGGNPFVLIDLGTRVFMEQSQVGSPPWTAVVNEHAGAGETVYLLGDATPFYVTGDVRYNTVYDRWPIEEAINAHPGEPGRWTQIMREDGIDLVVISFSELDRYARSGWLPDSIDPALLIEWIDSLGQPIEVWNTARTGSPLRAVFRIDEAAP